jgi:hypothetical protein
MLVGIGFVAVLIIAVVTVIAISLKKQNEENPPSTAPSSTIDSISASPDATATKEPLPEIEVTAIVFNKVTNDAVTIPGVGGTFPLGGKDGDGLSFAPPEATGRVRVHWKSDDTNVVIVNLEGGLEAVGPGTTKVWATVGEVTRACTVTVQSPDFVPPDPSANGGTGNPDGTIKLSNKDVTLSVSNKKTYGNSFTLKANGGTDGVYYSSDSTIATVSEKGVVTAVKKGYCKITVTVNGAQASCDIHVIA